MSQIVVKTSLVLMALVAGFAFLIMSGKTTNACSDQMAALGYCKQTSGGGSGGCWRSSTGTLICP